MGEISDAGYECLRHAVTLARNEQIQSEELLQRRLLKAPIVDAAT